MQETMKFMTEYSSFVPLRRHSSLVLLRLHLLVHFRKQLNLHHNIKQEAMAQTKETVANAIDEVKGIATAIKTICNQTHLKTSFEHIIDFRDELYHSYARTGDIKKYEQALLIATKGEDRHCKIGGSSLEIIYLPEIVCQLSDITDLNDQYPDYIYLTVKQALSAWDAILRQSKADCVQIFSKFCSQKVVDGVNGWHCTLISVLLTEHGRSLGTYPRTAYLLLNRTYNYNILLGLVYDLNDESTSLRDIVKRQGWGMGYKWLNDALRTPPWCTCIGYANQWLTIETDTTEQVQTATCELVYVIGYITMRLGSVSTGWGSRFNKILSEKASCTDTEDLLNFWMLQSRYIIQLICPDAREPIHIVCAKMNEKFYVRLRKEMARMKQTSRKNKSGKITKKPRKIMWSKLPYDL